LPRRQKITEPGLTKQQIHLKVVGETARHEHANRTSSEDAILFSMNDAPALKPFGLFREASQGASHIGM
jgi:gentisate 1,2-dioxygenase